jgi:sirohydrochlorin cobaltochelatase
VKKMGLLLLILPCCFCLQTARAQSAPAAPTQPQQARVGVMLLAHGGSALEWNEEVHHVADQVDLVMPTEIAFGMATQSSMQAAVNRLVARKVTTIVAVPLFVSSHSSVIDSIAYLLGLRTQEPEDLKTFAAMDHGGGPMSMDHGTMDHGAMDHGGADSEARKPISSPVPIRMASGLDRHRIVADILNDRAASISHDPAHEVVILIAHGPVPDDDNKRWLDDMSVLAAEMQRKSPATQQLREKVEWITKKGDAVLIVPLLLSYGGIEGGLRKRLAGLNYRMPGQGLLPDKRIVDWVIESAQ